MKFNPLQRGKKREKNTQEDLYKVLDAGFMCTIAAVDHNIPIMIPTAYGRKEDVLYFHGSNANYVLKKAIENDTICVSISHLDGLVLARTLFNTSINFRSATLFGKATKVEDKAEHLEALKIITDNIIPNRWQEVHTGTSAQIKATMVIKMKIEEATVKIRATGPEGDEKILDKVWSGVIPLKMIAENAIFDTKFGDDIAESKSVKEFILKNQTK